MRKIISKLLWKKRLKETLERNQGGIFKRIDEHRELIEHLKSNAPHVLESVHVTNWLRSLDQFLNELANTPIIEKDACTFKPRKGMPRPINFDQLGNIAKMPARLCKTQDAKGLAVRHHDLPPAINANWEHVGPRG